MCKKLLTLIVVLGLVSSASAVNVWWYGTVDTDIYNGDNYSVTTISGPASDVGVNWSISNRPSQGNSMFAVVDDDIGTMSYWSYCENASTADPYHSRVEIIRSTTTNYTANAGLTVGTVGYGKTTWYMEDADCLGWTLAVVGRTIGVVNPDAQSCSLLMYGDSLLDVDYIRVGRDQQPGYVGIHDTSVLDIDMSDGDTGIYKEVDETDGVIDLWDSGKIVWDGDHTIMGDDKIQELVDVGKIVAYGGSGTVQWCYDFMNDETIVTGIPEPATMALLGLGGLLLLRRKH